METWILCSLYRALIDGSESDGNSNAAVQSSLKQSECRMRLNFGGWFVNNNNEHQVTLFFFYSGNLETATDQQSCEGLLKKKQQTSQEKHNHDW